MFGDGVFVGAQDVFAASEGGNQHQQSGFGKVEVGQQGIDHTETSIWCVRPAPSGIDKNVGLAALRAYGSVRIGSIFKGSCRGGADGDYATTLFPCAFQGSCGDVIDLKGFGVKFVLLDDFTADGLEGSQADVERDASGLNVANPEFFEYPGGEVKACGWSCDGAGMLCEDSLVLVAILRLVVAMDVGRKWDVAEPLETGQEVRDVFEADGAFAEFAMLDDLGSQFLCSPLAEV